MKAARHRMGRKATMFPDTIDALRTLVEYDPIDGVIRYLGPYKPKPTRDKQGHLLMKLPVALFAVERKSRTSRYYRVDHIVWALTTGEWPTGWIEHLNGMRSDCSVDNLVHCDPDGRRWWQMNGTLVEVQGDGLHGYPITYVVTDGDERVLVPKLVGVNYEDDDDTESDGAPAPYPEVAGDMSQVPEPG